MTRYERAAEIIGRGYCQTRYDGSLIVAVESTDDERSAEEALDDALGDGTSAALAAAGYSIAWTGDGNTDAAGYTTDDIIISECEDQE